MTGPQSARGTDASHALEAIGNDCSLALGSLGYLMAFSTILSQSLSTLIR